MNTLPLNPLDMSCLVPNDQGWMTDVEIAAIVGYAFLNLARGDLLEIGCFKGRTSSGLTRAGRLTVVDTFLGSREHQEELQGRSFRKDFDANMYGATDVTVLEGDSHQILPRLPAGGFRLILVDASHEYEDVLRDLRDSWRLLSMNGYLFVDDYNRKTVERALNDFADENDLERGIRISGKLLCLKKKAR
jgi:SAM-dependent methyltransferase